MARCTLLVLLVAAVALVPLAAGQPWVTCGDGTYKKGSAYENNLLNLALTLRDGASSQEILFSTGSNGAAPNTVYGLLLCRGDISRSACYDCGTSVWRDAGRACHRAKDVALVYNECYARLSDKDDFLADKVGPGQLTNLMSTANISTTDIAGYDRAVTQLLAATAEYAAGDIARKLFATGQRVGTDPGFPNLYATAQCAFDITLEACRGCLEGLVARWWDTFPANVAGARMAGPRCLLRSEVYPFYTGAPMVVLRE
uniref:Gnk2-homologous domain-containing protein n=2 Tax=Oryza TaxID=4527 RepID=A0A0E0PF54_ORYRU